VTQSMRGLLERASKSTSTKRAVAPLSRVMSHWTASRGAETIPPDPMIPLGSCPSRIRKKRLPSSMWVTLPQLHLWHAEPPRLTAVQSFSKLTQSRRFGFQARRYVSIDALRSVVAPRHDRPASLPSPFILVRAAMAPYCFIMVRICRYCLRTVLTSWTVVPLPLAMRLRRLPSMTLWSRRS
jgi:hypothetical protein